MVSLAKNNARFGLRQQIVIEAYVQIADYYFKAFLRLGNHLNFEMQKCLDIVASEMV